MATEFPDGSTPGPKPEPKAKKDPSLPDLPNLPGPAGGEDAPPEREAAPVTTAAGALIGLLAWVWIGLPLIKGGPKAVAAVLRAKFTNQSLDGSFLS